MINVSRNYSEPVSGLDTILEEEDLSVIVKPPGFEDYDPLTQLAPLGTPNIELVELLGEENYIETVEDVDVQAVLVKRLLELEQEKGKRQVISLLNQISLLKNNEELKHLV